MFRFDPNDVDPVVRSVDRRLKREALRQLDAIDLDDDDARMEPLPPLDADALVEQLVGPPGRSDDQG
ncbi:MAG: hypothetical protein AAGA93_03195 [Actinomycetota bacterium]